MKSLKLRNSLLLILTAFIWGVAFVAQRTGGDAAGPYTFNCIRNFLGALVLLPVIRLLDHLKLTSKKPTGPKERKKLLIGGICCGTALFFASSAQQVGIYMGTEAGKAGFLTACYILIVPILGIFLNRKSGWNIWVGVLLALIGLYFLCMTGQTQFRASDLIVLLCALLFSVHILVIDHFSPFVDGVRMSCIQFFVCGLWSLIPMGFLEMKSIGFAAWGVQLSSWDVWIPILYAGIMSSGVAYTLQIVGQNGMNPTVASMLMSLESVFSVIAGALILQEAMSGKEYFGCLLIFAAILLAQLPIANLGKREKEES